MKMVSFSLHFLFQIDVHSDFRALEPVYNEKELAKETWKRIQMNKLNIKVGLMFASKPIVQLIVNPFIGPLTNK